MPDWAQDLTLINPMRYFIDGMRTVFIRGGNITSIGQQLLPLSLFATMMSLWSIWSYKKNN
jgi:ABC-2 type transport system permease protein